jgi:hypothetical protein
MTRRAQPDRNAELHARESFKQASLRYASLSRIGKIRWRVAGKIAPAASKLGEAGYMRTELRT